MANCIVTKLKDKPTSRNAEYQGYLRIPVVAKGGSIYAQRYYLKYTSSTNKCAFIVGEGHFTNTSQANYGTYQAANSAKEIASMFTDGDYSVYVTLRGLVYFLVNVTTDTIAANVASGLEYVNYDKLFANNPSLTNYYIPSVSKWFEYLTYLKNGDLIQFILPDKTVDEIAQHIISVLGTSVTEVDNGFSFVINPKTAWVYHSGKTAMVKNKELTVTINSATEYVVTGNNGSGVVAYTATYVDGVWIYADN